MTMQLDHRVNECARNLNDGKLLSILSSGDVVAQELKYHYSCLTALYHRERALLSTIENDTDNEASKEKEMYPLVFSELLAYIKETNINSDNPTVFRLADLISIYSQRLVQLGLQKPDINSTRLKEKLLAEIPELEACKKGRDVLLAFRMDIGEVLQQASNYSDAIILTKAAKILRGHMINHKSTFSGTFHEGCVESSIPPAFLQFVCMIEHGADIKSQLRFGASRTDLALSQLLQYNCYSKYREGATTFRPSKDRESPFAVYLGMSFYAKTRKRQLVEILHEHGLSIPYDRVLSISAQLGDAVKQYIEEGVVCPSIMKKGLFTSAAMDNIDHNPTATTATTSFHGTSISLFQHPTTDNAGENRESLQIEKKVPELPDSYTNIPPAFFVTKNPIPSKLNLPSTFDANISRLDLTHEHEWLAIVRNTDIVDDLVNISWSAHRASKNRGPAFEMSVTSLLPFLRDQAHSVATIRHVMDKIKDTVAYLNPSQIPVFAADQPIYALAKQIQWHWPERYGEDKNSSYVWSLHIEMAALKSIGTLLQNSGWTGAMVEAGIASSGTAESYLSASSVTRTRQMHQVTVVTLYKLLKEAYMLYSEDTNDENFDLLSVEDWCKKPKDESPHIHFWLLVLNMELTILPLVRAFRKADFALYRQALAELIPFFFANNNVNYARWLPIHLRDMITIEHIHPELAAEFHNGKFVVHKSNHTFSALAIDQAHEQANAIIKGDGGAIGVTEDPSALRRWMVAGPEVSHLVAQYETAFEAKDANTRHHEHTKESQTLFFEKVQKLYTVMKDLGNPFTEETADLLTLDPKSIAHPTASRMVFTHYDNGKRRYDEFVKGLDNDECRFYQPIKRNKTDFFRQTPDQPNSDVKQKNLKDDCRLFSTLFISCQSRECDLLEFFQHENQSFPASLSENGKLHSCQKSQLAAILEAYVTFPDSEPEAIVLIADGSALINSLTPRLSKTFEEYAALEVVPKIQVYSRSYTRTDIVFDVYWSSSLTAETIKARYRGKTKSH